MILKNLLLILLGLFFVIRQEAHAEELIPITRECIHAAARYKNLPVAALYGILITEGGTVGQYSTNKNQTRDNGPMQINSVWAEALGEMDITEVQLRNNGCLNVLVSAWILRKHLDRTGNIWEAIGDYHSKDPEKGNPYIQRVMANLITIRDYDVLIARANKQVGWMP